MEFIYLMQCSDFLLGSDKIYVNTYIWDSNYKILNNNIYKQIILFRTNSCICRSSFFHLIMLKIFSTDSGKIKSNFLYLKRTKKLQTVYNLNNHVVRLKQQDGKQIINVRIFIFCCTMRIFILSKNQGPLM